MIDLAPFGPLRSRFVALACVALLGGAAPSAVGAVFNVASPATPGASDVTCAPCATIQGGVNKAAAAAGADEVLVAAGSFSESVTIAAGNDVTVTGSGPAATTLDGGALVALTMDAPATVRRIRISGTGGRIVNLNGGTIAEARVESPAASSTNTAVNIGTGTGSAVVRDSTVSMPLSATANYGIYIDTTTGEPQIVRSVIEAGYAVDVGSPRPVVISQSRLAANIYGVWADGPSTSVAVQGCLVLPVTAASSSGTGVSKRVTSTATVTVTGSTIVGTGRTTGVGAESNAMIGGFVNVVDSILWGHLVDVNRFAVAGGNPTISLTRTLYDPTKVNLVGPGVLDVSGGGNLTGVAPGFVSELTGDYRLLAGSPAIDAGTTGGLAAGEPAIDIGGDPRISDGNGDGVARRDIGAFERLAPPAVSPPPPPPPPSPVTPRLKLAKIAGTVRNRTLRLRVTAGAAGRLVLVARNAAGRVVGRRVVARLSAGRGTVAVKLSARARTGPLVVVATLTGPDILPAKEILFTPVVLPRPRR